MLFLILMAIPYIAPIIGYYWVIRKIGWQQTANPVIALICLVSLFELSGIVFIGLILVLEFILCPNCIAYSGIIFASWEVSPIIYGWIFSFVLGILAPFILKLYQYLAKRSQSQKSKPDAVHRLGHVFSVGLLVLAPLVPMFIYSSATSNCYYKSLQEAGSLIEALEAYRAERGYYPRLFNALTPDMYDPPPVMLENVPVPACFPNSIPSTFDMDYLAYYLWIPYEIVPSLPYEGNIEVYVLIWFLGPIYLDSGMK